MTTRTALEVDGTVKSFRDWVKADGSTEFQPESERYHLYVQYLGPFGHIAIMGRSIKGLEKTITMDNLDYVIENSDKSWKFSPEREGCDADSVHGASYLREIYDTSAKKLGASGFSGAVTVPVLFDKKLGRIVSTESADILRMLSSEFNDFCDTEEQKRINLYPESLRDQIEEMESWTLKDVIQGVYGPPLAQSQQAYDAAIASLSDALDKLEALLSKQRYLVGGQLTGADVRLFACLIRFDVVYIQVFNARKRIQDYPALWGFVRNLYQTPAIRKTVWFEQIVKGYFLSYFFKHSNPYSIVPATPKLDYDVPTDREHM